MAKSDEKEEKKEKDFEEKPEDSKEEEDSEGREENESAVSGGIEPKEEVSAGLASKPTAEELLHSELPKVSEEEGAEDHDGYSSESEKEELGNEHTLNDLASEDPGAANGVEPSRPRSFMMDQDGPTNLNQQIPSSGVYGGGRNKGGKRKTLMLLIIALVVIGGLIYLLKGRLLGGNKQEVAPPSPTVASETPTPTPTPSSIDRTKYTVDVLNGSGKTGLAASVSASLKTLGYQIGKTGNATNSAFTTTQVLAKSATPQDVVNALIKDLSPDYNATNGGVLSDSSTADLEVIIGAK